MTMRFPIAFLAFVLFALPARADRIDGDWCGGGGKHFRIDGSDIRTPAGTLTTGDYSRHFFHYVVPAGDPDAGQTIDMALQSEELLFLRRTSGGVSGPEEEWRRCQVTS